VSDAFTITGTDGIAAGLGKGAPPGAEAMKSPFSRPGLSWGGGLTWRGERRQRAGRDRVGPGVPPDSAAVSSAAAVQTPTTLPTSPERNPLLPVSGFPLAQVDVVALMLIGVGVASCVGRRRRPL
jgi:hypothetical protein